MLFRPKIQSVQLTKNSWSSLYVEHRRIHQDKMGLVLETQQEKESIPINNLSALLIGPGCSITSAAIKDLADHNCFVCWVGEEGVKFYSGGLGGTTSGALAEHHARVWADPVQSKKVIQRMYEIRYPGSFPDVTNLPLNAIRGHEGMRVKQAYQDEATKRSIPWLARSLTNQDPANQAISSTSACLYPLCHAAIVSLGLIPSLGFLHQNNCRGFALDIADMYRETFTIPIAFDNVSNPDKIRKACRDRFVRDRLLGKIVQDIYTVLGLP